MPNNLTGVRIEALGLGIVIDGADESGIQRLLRDWSRCWARRVELPPVSDDTSMVVSLPSGSSPEAIHYATTSMVTLRLVGELVGSGLMLHACGLSDREGRVVALVGESGAGKSTAAQLLASKVFGYVTDELVFVQEDHRVRRFPKPLAFVGSDGAKVQRGPDDMGLLHCADDLTLSRLVLLDRVRDASVVPSLVQVAAIDALLALIPHTSGFPHLDQPLTRLAHVLAACGGAHRLTYSEIDDAQSLLTDLMSHSDSEPVAYQVMEPPEPPDTVHLNDGRLVRSRWQDAISLESEGLLMIQGRPMRLSPIGRTIWTAIGEGADSSDLADLVEIVVANHGPHPEAALLVAQAVAALIDAGAVVHKQPVSLTDVLAGRSSDASA